MLFLIPIKSDFIEDHVYADVHTKLQIAQVERQPVLVRF